ncbi:MAG: flagellar protein FlgN [Zoogloeaceae bacterium]|nr:flagellar protein FlgN [Zoogloeaceae bacterium]
MISPAARTRFAHHVENELSTLERFEVLLRREQTLLVAGDTEALIAMTPQKTELHQQLQRQHDQLVQLLGHEHVALDADAVRGFCADLPDTRARWERILELGAEVRALNELNGKLILERMQSNQAALSALLSAAGQPALYDAEGAARPTGRGRHLGSA